MELRTMEYPLGQRKVFQERYNLTARSSASFNLPLLFAFSSSWYGRGLSFVIDGLQTYMGVEKKAVYSLMFYNAIYRAHLC